MGAIGRARKRRWTDAAVRPIPRTIAPLTRWSCVRRRRIMAFTLRSPAFAGDDRSPHRFARDGANLSPPLEWSDPPEGTRSYALIVADPDAPRGMCRHWAVFAIGRAHARAPVTN